MQVMTLIAMEPPVCLAGEGSANFIRDAKVNVLKSISPLTTENLVLGQYVADSKGNEGYLDGMLWCSNVQFDFSVYMK